MFPLFFPFSTDCYYRAQKIGSRSQTLSVTLSVHREDTDLICTFLDHRDKHDSGPESYMGGQNSEVGPLAYLPFSKNRNVYGVSLH